MGDISVSMSDLAIARELYTRVEAHRKRNGLSQTDVADKLGITPKSYRAIKNGTCKLTTFIALLRALDLLENFNSLIQEPKASPIQLAKSWQISARKAHYPKDRPLTVPPPAPAINKLDDNTPLVSLLQRKKLIVKDV